MHCEIGGTQGPLGYVSALGAMRLVHWLILVAPSCLRSHNAQYIMLKSLIITYCQRCNMFLNMKRNIFISMVHIPHCGILTYQLYTSKDFIVKYPMFYIAAIFVKYWCTTGSWLFWLMSWCMLFRLPTTRGKVIMKQDYSVWWFGFSCQWRFCACLCVCMFGSCHFLKWLDYFSSN